MMISEPKLGMRKVLVTERRTKIDFAQTMKHVAEMYPDAEVVRVVLDNLNTHKVASLYEAFPPEEARAIARKLEFHYTPKHGSWLNMAEIELHVLNGQCLNRHISKINEVEEEVSAWQRDRNNKKCKINWQFTTKDARIKLKKLYPSIYA